MEGSELKASKMTAAYTGHVKSSLFAAESRHSAFPLDDAATRRDDWLAQQQGRLGAAAHAVCLAMTKANEVADRLAATGVLPSGAHLNAKVILVVTV